MNDILQWFASNAAAYHEKFIKDNKGVDTGKILNDIALKAMYSKVDGGLQLKDSFRTLSFDES